MILETHTDAEAEAVFARAKAKEFRILSMSRVRSRNSAWSFVVTNPPEQPELIGRVHDGALAPQQRVA